MTLRTLTVGLGDRSYPIHIGRGLLARAELLSPHLASRRAAVVTNTTVAPLYAEAVERAIAACGATSFRVVIPDGEAEKRWETLDRVYGELLAAQADRKTVIVALGGGVVGDLAGFAAATYQRGVSFIQVPTTLLAQVDSSVGGKTGVNHPLGKNMIGAFHQPLAVVAIYRDFMDTLPDREPPQASPGGQVRRPPGHRVMGWLEGGTSSGFAPATPGPLRAHQRSCEIEVGSWLDEQEAGPRALLNLGHTFGHAIETLEGYGTWLHGEAVAAGMVMAARFSARLGRAPESDAHRLEALLRRAGLPVAPPRLPADRWLDAMGRDKKNESGRITLVLLDRLGAATVEKNAPAAELEAFLAGR